MTLLEQAKALEKRAIRRRDIQILEAEAELFRTRTRNLEEHLDQAEEALARATVLRSASFPVMEPIPPPAEQLAAYAAKLPDEASRPFAQAAWQKFIIPMGRFAAACEETVADTLATVKRDFLLGVTAAGIQGYVLDPATRVRAGQLLTTFQDLTNRDWTNASASELAGVLKAAARFRDDFKSMREGGASDDLRAFLALARSTGGASIDVLTDALRAELATRNILQSVRIVIR